MKIGISSCLLGTMCRYDGGHAKNKFVLDEIGKYFEFIPFCPEKMIFTTPREAIRLVRSNGEIKVITSNSQKEVTKEVNDISKELANEIKDDELCGFIFKSKSPTCGMERVKIYPDNKNGQSENTGVGIFANEVKQKFPLLPTEEEGRLEDPWLRENFLMQIFSYREIFIFLKDEPTFKKLVDFHSSYKYLVYAKSHQSYKKLGKIVANHEKKRLEVVLEEYTLHFLETIYEKSTIANTYNVLLHIFGYFKKLITKDEKTEILKSIEEFKKEIVPLIVVIKILNLYVKRFDIKYLETQKFLHPYPKDLGLRSDTKAYR